MVEKNTPEFFSGDIFFPLCQAYQITLPDGVSPGVKNFLPLTAYIEVIPHAAIQFFKRYLL